FRGDSTLRRFPMGLGPGLLEAQGVNRIEGSGPVRWIEAESDTDRGADKQAGDCPTEREDQLDLQPKSEQIPADHPEKNSEQTACFGDKDGLGQKLAQDVATPCTDRLSHSDFFCPLGHAD